MTPWLRARNNYERFKHNPPGKPCSDSGHSKIVSFFQPESSSKSASLDNLASCNKLPVSATVPSKEVSTGMEMKNIFYDQLIDETDTDVPSEGVEIESPNSDLLLSAYSTIEPIDRASFDSDMSVTVSNPQQTPHRSYPKSINVGTKKKQPTLDNLFDRVTKFKSSDSRAKTITN